jgi:DNA-binding MarR family transcriptional regulator
MSDDVDAILEQWHRERPELPTEAMGIFGRVFRISASVGDAMTETYREFGISRSEFDVLATLRRSGQPFLTPGSLATSMMMTTGGMTGRLDRLERAGLLTREPDPHDRRGLRVSLTPAGRRLIDQAVAAGVATQERLLAPLTSRQRSDLTRLLSALMAATAPPRP